MPIVIQARAASSTHAARVSAFAMADDVAAESEAEVVGADGALTL